jgi:hypothetical protein
MSLVERLSLKLTEEQRERFLLLVAANPGTPEFLLYQDVINTPEP